MIGPLTWKPTSTTFSGMIVPVALIEVTRSPRVTGEVFKATGAGVAIRV